MKKTLLIFGFILIAFLAWALPYIKELRHEGLTFAIAYDYFIGRPDHSFNSNDAVPQLDYSKESSWASLPFKKDEADLIPAGVVGVDQLNSKVDVFFVHPTGYLKGHHWTDPLEKESATKENTVLSMAAVVSMHHIIVKHQYIVIMIVINCVRKFMHLYIKM